MATKYTPVTRDQERDLIQRWQSTGCERSRRALYDAFLPLLTKYARKRRDIPLDDAVQIASIGFIKALDTFDLDNGARFATHIAWQVKAAFSVTNRRDKRYLRNRFKEITTLDGPAISEGKEWRNFGTFKDNLIDPSRPDYDWHRVANSLSQALQGLTERERVILLGRARDLTLDTLGAHYGVSKERIRQIESKALDKMRKRVDKGMRYYLEDVG